MKKTALIVVLVLLAAVSAFAQSEDDFEVEQLSDNTLKITKYKGTVTDVVIPETLYGLKVTVIGNSAFEFWTVRQNDVFITSVAIPDTVTEIGAYAFRGHDDKRFSELTSITLGKGLVTIGPGAFTKNGKLTDIVIPDSVVRIGDGAFFECGLTSVTLGKGVQYIFQAAFRENAIAELALPASVKVIGGSAFESNQIKSLVLPNGVTFIGKEAFFGNPLETLVIPDSLAKASARELYKYSFEFANANNWKDDRTGIGEYAFPGRQLIQITIPANMSDFNIVALPDRINA
jgi:hypothetical protein